MRESLELTEPLVGVDEDQILRGRDRGESPIDRVAVIPRPKSRIETSPSVPLLILVFSSTSQIILRLLISP